MGNPLLKLVPEGSLALLRAIGEREVSVLYLTKKLGRSREAIGASVSRMTELGLLTSRTDPALSGEGSSRRRIYKLVPEVRAAIDQLSNEEAA